MLPSATQISTNSYQVLTPKYPIIRWLDQQSISPRGNSRVLGYSYPVIIEQLVVTSNYIEGHINLVGATDFYKF